MKKTDELLSSNYDGIKEYDNDLPKWWLWLFVITIIYAFVYICYFQLGSALNSEQQLAAEMTEIYKLQQESAPKTSSSSSLAALVKDPTRIAAGKVVYDTRCLACHGPQGGGIIGPNLVDDAWIHGGKLSDIRKVIHEGVVEKGMLAWKGVLSEREIDDVTIYIRSIRGTAVAGAKAPQGEIYAGDE
jgi:cytochrome c oxidase cbb3-type subunit 3